MVEDDLPTTAIIVSQSEGSKLPQKESSATVEKVDNVETAAVKSLNNSGHTKNDGKSPIRSKDQLGKISSEKKMKDLKANLKAAEKFFEKSDFLNASKECKKVLKIEDIDTMLSVESYRKAFQCYCDSYLNLWKKEEDQEVRNDFFKTAFSSLEKYLSKEKNVEESKKFFMCFAASVFEHTVLLIKNHPYSSFRYFSQLLKMDIKHKDLICDGHLNEYIDDILHNMTVCISEQKSAGKVFNTMSNKMKKVLKGPLITDNQKNTYQKWLEQEWDDELVEEIK